MRLKILSPVHASGLLLQPGAMISLPDSEALALFRAKAAEPVGRTAIDCWAAHVASDLAAQKRHDAWMAEVNERAIPKTEFLGRGPRAGRYPST
ncbi:hypothetical protein [Polaromonas sp.]|uniref:hypothetical protein n=1 Tax=Polaromonas sp. TaxID=1869339 RepID=UPI003753A5E5